MNRTRKSSSFKKSIRSKSSANRQRYMTVKPTFFKVGAFILAILVLIWPLYRVGHRSVKAETAYLYPTSCLGNWDDSTEAQLSPDSTDDRDDSTSAIMHGQDQQIFCGLFSGDIPPGAQPEHVSLRLYWHKVPLQESLPDLSPETTELATTSEEELAESISTTDPSSVVTSNIDGLVVPTSSDGDVGVSKSQTNLFEGAAEDIIVRYTVDGDSWEQVGSFSSAGDSLPSNFDLPLPITENLDKVLISIESTSATDPVVVIALDSLALKLAYYRPADGTRPHFTEETIVRSVSDGVNIGILTERRVDGYIRLWLVPTSDLNDWLLLAQGDEIDPNTPLAMKENSIFWLASARQAINAYDIRAHNYFGATIQPDTVHAGLIFNENHMSVDFSQGSLRFFDIETGEESASDANQEAIDEVLARYAPHVELVSEQKGKEPIPTEEHIPEPTPELVPEPGPEIVPDVVIEPPVEIINPHPEPIPEPVDNYPVALPLVQEQISQ